MYAPDNEPPPLVPMSILHTRRRQPELMDELDLDERQFVGSLIGLRRINRITRSADILWSYVAPLANQQSPAVPLRVLDVACGGGDSAIALWRRAERAGLPVEVHGCDINPHAVAFASREAEKAGIPIRFFPHDAVNDPFPSDYDVITSSLFLHHLDEAEAVRFLESARKAARRAVVIHDLARGLPGYLLAWIGVRLLTRSPVCHIDGPRSVEGAFTLGEARELALRAGMKDVLAEKRFPFRFVLLWKAP
jgi:SAM-dependent methyltransferase